MNEIACQFFGRRESRWTNDWWTQIDLWRSTTCWSELNMSGWWNATNITYLFGSRQL